MIFYSVSLPNFATRYSSKEVITTFLILTAQIKQEKETSKSFKSQKIEISRMNPCIRTKPSNLNSGDKSTIRNINRLTVN